MGRSAVVVVALVVLACSKTPPPATSSSPEAAAAAVAKLDDYRVEACACVGLECTLRVDDARAAWVVSEHGRFTFTDEQRTAAAAANRAYQVCFEALRETKADRAVRELAALADEMCACPSKPCADAVMARTTALGERHQDTTATAANMAEATAITERLTACLASAHGEAPAPPPVAAAVPSPPEPSADQLDAFRARACACRDDECVAVVARERHQWFLAVLGRDLVDTEQQRDALDLHHQAFDECSQPRDAAVHRLLSDFRLLADDMCACTTPECVSAIHAKADRWRKQVDDRALGDELALRFRANGDRYLACHERRTPIEVKAVGEIEALRDEACACKSAACGEPLKHELEELGRRYQDTRGSQDVMTHVATVTETLVACLLKLGVTM